ncbi:MAG: DUF1080 domain-containing protein [Sphingobacteriales bacterium]
MRKYQYLFLTILLSVSFLSSDAQKKAGDWANLFDGKTLKGWKQVNGNFKVRNQTIIGTMMINPNKPFPVTVKNDGSISGFVKKSGPNSFLISNKEYSDFILELDAKIDNGVENSGVQIRSYFDPKGNVEQGEIYGSLVTIDPSDQKWTGGIKDVGTRDWIIGRGNLNMTGNRDWLYPMSLNTVAQAAFKPGRYNHIKIECIGGTTKTWVNGIPAAYLVDTVERKGIIALRVDGTNDSTQTNKKAYFKNIRIKTTGLKPTPFPPGIFVVNYRSNQLTDYEKKDGWKLLFDGKTNTGWRSATSAEFPTKPDGWIIRDGTMTILGSAGGEAANVGDIITKEQYSAFDLSFEFRMSRGANSGVKYFVTLNEDTKGSAIGLEYQVLDDAVHPDAKLGRNGDRTLASLYDLIPANKQARFVHPIGAWNTGRIIVYPNNHVEHYLNGVKVLEYERGSKEFKDLVAISKYVIWKNFGEAKEGHILLQDHGFEVNFRSIKIKPLHN